MTQPVFQRLPLGDPEPPTDNIGTEIKVGDPIAYAVSDGYLHTGIVRDIVHKVTDQYDWSTKTTNPVWNTRLKVQTMNEDSSYRKTMRHVSLTKMNNVIVLRGAEAAEMVEHIEESWVDKGL